MGGSMTFDEKVLEACDKWSRKVCFTVSASKAFQAGAAFAKEEFEAENSHLILAIEKILRYTDNEDVEIVCKQVLAKLNSRETNE
jgi:hypothetical protein